MKNKDKYANLAFLLNGFLFCMGGILSISGQETFFGILQLTAAFLNILMVIRLRKTITEKLNFAILAMNIIVCLIIAVEHIQANKMYIQYVWILSAIFSLVALIVGILKKRNFVRRP